MPKTPRKYRHEELFAKLVLERAFPDRYGPGLEIVDRPDLWCEGADTGVEVVSSEPEKSRELIGIYLNWCNDPTQRDKLAAKIREKGGSLFGDSLAQSYAVNGIRDPMGAVSSKMDKLDAGGYRRFAHQHLLVHSEVAAPQGALGGMLGDMVAESLRHAIRFERVMLLVPGTSGSGNGAVIYDFDLVGRSLATVRVPRQVVWEIGAIEASYYGDGEGDDGPL